MIIRIDQPPRTIAELALSISRELNELKTAAEFSGDHFKASLNGIGYSIEYKAPQDLIATEETRDSHVRIDLSQGKDLRISGSGLEIHLDLSTCQDKNLLQLAHDSISEFNNRLNQALATSHSPDFPVELPSRHLYREEAPELVLTGTNKK